MQQTQSTFTHTPSRLGPVQPVGPCFLLTKLISELRVKIFDYVAAQPRIHVAQINESNSYAYAECLEDIDLEESDPRYESMIATRKLRVNDPNDSIDPTFCNNHCTCQLTVSLDTVGSNPSRSPVIDLKLTCREIHDEINHSVYHQRKFIFRSYLEFRHYVRDLSDENCKHLRNITLLHDMPLGFYWFAREWDLFIDKLRTKINLDYIAVYIEYCTDLHFTAIGTMAHPNLTGMKDRNLTLPLTLLRHALHPADPGWETSRRERVDMIAYFGQCFTGYDPHPGWIEEIKRRMLRITPCDDADRWESGRERNGGLW